MTWNPAMHGGIESSGQMCFSLPMERQFGFLQRYKSRHVKEINQILFLNFIVKILAFRSILNFKKSIQLIFHLIRKHVS